MGSLGNPKTWAPYKNTKDCTQGFCSLSCPQWCYIIFPPPPPFPLPQDKSQTGSSSFSPLVITIIGVLASAFLLVSYYAIVSKYCGNSTGASRRRDHHNQPPNGDIEVGEYNRDHHHEPWLVISTHGLDEALIKAITLVKYKGDAIKGHFGNSTDCSVCLGEFLEDDTLRVLPKCNHAFHVSCIDTWLKSHSNCPLCRANIVSSFAQPIQPTPHNDNNTLLRDHENQLGNEEIRSIREGSGNLPKNPVRAFSDLGELGLRGSSVIGSIRDQRMWHMMRRSISMDHYSHETRVSISDIVRINQGENCQVRNCELHDQSVKEEAGESSKSGTCCTGGSSIHGSEAMMHGRSKQLSFSVPKTSLFGYLGTFQHPNSPLNLGEFPFSVSVPVPI